jgi:dihydrofolate reductase
VEHVVSEALDVAQGRDVYIDGGALIRSALALDLVDRLTVSVVPVVLGKGIPLFAGLPKKVPLRLSSSRPIGSGLVELVYEVPRGSAR